MTKKEQLRMDAIISENAQLRNELDKHFKVYSETMGEVVSLRARIETMREVMGWPIGCEHEP